MAARPEVTPPEEETSLPLPIGSIDLELKGKELGIKYFLVSYSPLNADTRVSLIPRRAIRNVQQNGCGIPAAMFFKADGADPEMCSFSCHGNLSMVGCRGNFTISSNDLYMNGKPFVQCPRRSLKKLRRIAQEKGFVMKSGIEPEFTIMSRDGSSLGDDLDEQQPMSLQCPLATMRMSPILMKIYEVMEKLGWGPYEDKDLGISSLAKHFIGGLLKHAQSSCALLCPTVNSYKRLSAGSWCPNSVTWGGNNRTVMIRVPASNRVEHRLADGSANPYLIQAVILAAGLNGIDSAIGEYREFEISIFRITGYRISEPDPPPKLDIQVCDSKEKFPVTPKTLKEAVDALKKDEELVCSLGSEIVEGFCYLKLNEWEKYMWDISDWERGFYLDC
ncbi:hypothetical protein CAPTEDRAFT_195430 [Capitella teleta]|uniref:GS catalytic domain-containing protein n=1 Tax=Capitella teleta TaxID=283909 RepID=R7V2E1_CAPTE|nr:hypothetical protein CAPTEDRAFT_195430 [Capitella teleta]|eukprot:ELU12669.1 hypothetical protein CAPTEDRAFT_195430 [Capitella teleta]